MTEATVRTGAVTWAWAGWWIMNRKISCYEGNEPYIFVSYAHRDSEQVLGILKMLSEQGYRIWYDDGIEPGSAWSENIAEHLSRAEVVLVLGSENYVNSQNCRQEIEFSISEERNLLVVWLENTPLSAGLKMRLSMIQSIAKYQMPSEEFEQKLFQNTGIARCKGVSAAAQVSPVAGAPFTQVSPVAGPQDAAFFAGGQNPVSPDFGRVSGEVKGGNTIPKKKKSKLIPILIGVLAAVILLVGGIFLFGSKDKNPVLESRDADDTASVNICGKKYDVDKTRVILIENQILTPFDLENIGKLKELTSLTLDNCGLENLTQIHFSEKTKLHSVYLPDNPGLDDRDIAELSGIRDNLRTLVLNNTGVTSLESLLPLKNIDSLSLNGCKGFKDTDQLAQLNKLQGLYISETGITSLEKLQSLTNLKNVTAAGNHLTTLKGLEHCLNLERLYANGNLLTTTDGLENATQLKVVNLSGNAIRDASVLEKSIATLKYVDLSENPIEDVEFLRRGKKLEALWLDKTGITSLEMFQMLPALKTLSLRNSRIEGENLDLDFINLEYLDVSGNRLKGSFTIGTNTSSSDLLLMDNQLDHFYIRDKVNDLYLSGNPIVGLGMPGAKIRTVHLGYSKDMDFSEAGTPYIKYEDVPLDLRVNMEKENRKISFVERSDSNDAAEEVINSKYKYYFGTERW